MLLEVSARSLGIMKCLLFFSLAVYFSALIFITHFCSVYMTKQQLIFVIWQLRVISEPSCAQSNRYFIKKMLSHCSTLYHQSLHTVRQPKPSCLHGTFYSPKSDAANWPNQFVCTAYCSSFTTTSLLKGKVNMFTRNTTTNVNPNIIVFLPPNTMSLLQPMDQDVKASFMA